MVPPTTVAEMCDHTLTLAHTPVLAELVFAATAMAAGAAKLGSHCEASGLVGGRVVLGLGRRDLRVDAVQQELHL